MSTRKFRIGMATSGVALLGLLFYWIIPEKRPNVVATDIGIKSTTGVTSSTQVIARPASRPAPRLVRGIPASEGLTDYYPLIVARGFEEIDPAVIAWIQRVAEFHVATAPLESKQFEVAAEQLTEILSHTPLAAQPAVKIGSAFFEQRQTAAKQRKQKVRSAGSDEEFIPQTELEFLYGLRFLMFALSKVEAEIKRTPLSDVEITRLEPVIRELVACFDAMDQFEPAVRSLDMLASLQPSGSDEQYRDRYRSARLLMVEQRLPALTATDALIADVDQGKYPAPNLYDLAKLRWELCSSLDRRDEGLQSIRAMLGRTEGTQVARRLTGLLIRALAEMNKLDEAEAIYKTWAAGPEQYQDNRSEVTKLLALAMWRQQQK